MDGSLSARRLGFEPRLDAPEAPGLPLADLRKVIQYTEVVIYILRYFRTAMVDEILPNATALTN